ncbi:MAG TPA: 5'-nucleotidase C-terminal domain-containing protein [Bacteroidota bacterium]|nr:5'-nucleotidase C-terminal domain-containing protein [Bacteroidota bacterium]
MQRILNLFSLCAVLVTAQIVYGQTDTITILHVNDTHSNLAPIGPRDNNLRASHGGIARAATVIGMTRQTDSNVLLLHAGDAFIGDLFFNQYFGVPEFQLMASLGFDAMTAGNHEFDLGPGTLLQSLQAAFPSGGFPFLSANLILPDSTVAPLANYIHPYTIKQEGSVKVGIFGMTTPTTNYLSSPSPAVFDTSLVPIASAMVDTLRAHGCTMIILLSHLGNAVDNVIAQYTSGINVIVGGHDHILLKAPQCVVNHSGDTTFIVQVGAFYQYMGKLQFTVSANKVKLLSYKAIPLDSTIAEDPTVAATVTQLIAGIEATYGPVFSQKIGTATDFFAEVADSLVCKGSKDTPIGNLVTDAFRDATGADIAIEAGGSTAQPLYKGPLVGADVFRVVGYGFNQDNGLGFRLATFKMTGASIYAGLEFGVSAIEQDDEYFLQVSGMRYIYDPGLPDSLRILYVGIGGQPLDLAKTYTVASNEYTLLTLNFLDSAMGLPITYTDPHICTDSSEFQILSSYIAKRGTASPIFAGRILSAPVTKVSLKSSLLPAKFFLSQNYPNPFNPATTFRFSVPQAGHVTIKIYDVLGKEVAELVDGQLKAGEYTVTWNAGNFASGVYFCRMEAGTFISTKKLLLLK